MNINVPPPGTQPQRWLIMSWDQQDPGTPQLPYFLEKVCIPYQPYPMKLQMHINLPYFLVCDLTSLWREYFCVFSTLILPCICFHRHVFLRNFILWLACTSVMAWDLMLVDYHLLQFHGLYNLPLSSIYFLTMGLQLVMKLVVPLMPWGIPCLFV